MKVLPEITETVCIGFFFSRGDPVKGVKIDHP